MPGPRLTHEDRRQIATWLTDGLGYAEIARRLDRPTSTISREVARNSEAGRYHPDRAQQTAGLRARRGKPDRPAPPATDEPSTQRVRDFVEQLAAILVATGLPRMTARVFVCLLTSDSGSATAADLVRRLQVSPAAVSKSVGYLERMALLARGPDPGRRRERYVIVDDVWVRAWRTDTGAHAKVADVARRGTEIFGADTPAGLRLGQMAQFFEWLSGQMNDSTVTDRTDTDRTDTDRTDTDSTGHDAMTVLAALTYVTRPLTVDHLVTALDWPRKRVTDALAAIDRRPLIADPLALVAAGPATYTVAVRPDRLSPAQRKALP